MIVTGYMLRNAIRRWQLQRDTAAAQFTGTLTQFPGETKPTPDAVVAELLAAERAIAQLQAAQSVYNSRVEVHVPGLEGITTICAAVKLVGGAARIEKMWRGVVAPTRDRYDSSPGYTMVRDKDHERAVWTMTTKDMAARAAKAGAVTSALRAAIAEGNSVKIEVELDSALLAE